MTAEVRYAHGHRFKSDPVTGDDRCLGCGWDGLGQISVCRPHAPRCEHERCQNPADVLEWIGDELFVYCAPCRNRIRVRV